MMKLLEQMPDTVSQKIRNVLTHEEEEFIRVSTDLNPDGTFGEQWVVVTDKRVIVMPTEGVDGVVDVPIKELVSIQTEPLVGGGRLEIKREKQATLFVPYSSSLAEKFSEVARGLEQLRQQDEFFINTELDRTRCSKCGRLLPEKDGVCTACIRQLATLGRIADYLKPYKWRAGILALVSLVTIGSELIPPQITRHIVDNVFLPPDETADSIDNRAVLHRIMRTRVDCCSPTPLEFGIGARLDSELVERAGNSGYSKPSLSAVGDGLNAILR